MTPSRGEFYTALSAATLAFAALVLALTAANRAAKHPNP